MLSAPGKSSDMMLSLAVQAEAVVANALVTLTAGAQAGAKEGLSLSADGFTHARVLLNNKAAPRADHDSEGHAFEQARKPSA